MADVLYEAPNLVMQFEAKSGWIYARWLGRQSPENIKSGGRAMVTALRGVAAKHSCSRVLNDNRDVVGSWSHSLEWAASIFGDIEAARTWLASPKS